MEGPATAAGGRSSTAGRGPAATGQGGPTDVNSAGAEGVVTTYRGGHLPVPAPARPWIVACRGGSEKLPVTVYGRLPDGSVRPYSVTLKTGYRLEWRLTHLVPLVNDLGVFKGDRVRLTREAVAAGGTAAGGMGVVVEKAAGQQQQGQGQHRRRHVRTTVHIDPPLDPSGPSAARVVVSGDRKFRSSSLLHIPKDVVPCLLQPTRIEEARAAATANGGTTPRYVVTVYARRAGEDGPPLQAFPGATLTPTPCRLGQLIWLLSGLGPLRRHLGVAPSSLVRLVREVGQDSRVRLVVEPREGEEGQGGGGGAKRKGARGPRVEEEDGEELEVGGEDDDDVGSSGASSGSGVYGGSEAGSSDSEGWPDEDSSSGEPDGPIRRPRRGVGGTKRAQPRLPKAQQQQPQQPLPPLPPLPLLPLQPQTQVGQQQQQQQRRQELVLQGGGGGDGSGPFSAVGPGAGEAREGAVDGEAGRPGKRRRLKTRTDLLEEESAGRYGALQSGVGAEQEPLCLNATMLAAHTDSIRAALEAAEAKVAALQVDKAALEAEKAALEGSLAALAVDKASLEGQLGRERVAREAAQQPLGRERERAEAAEAQLLRARQHMAGLMQRFGLPVQGSAGQQGPPAPPMPPPQQQQPQPQPSSQPRTPAQPQPQRQQQ